MSEIYKGDNLQAFDGKPIKIEIDNPEEIYIKEAYVVINNGAVVKKYEEPTNEILVELDSKDTAKLSYKNTMKLIVVDYKGRKRTCPEELEFTASKEVYHVK